MQPLGAPAIDLGQELTTGFAGRCIRRKASQLIGKVGFTASDRPDLEQELTLLILRRVKKFNPRLAHWNAFTVTLIERHAATILRSRLAQKRTGRAISLDATQLAIGREPDIRAADLCHDVRTLLESLPRQVRCLGNDLQHESLSAIATRLRVSRSRLLKLRKQLRGALVRAGFQEFDKKYELLARHTQ